MTVLGLLMSEVGDDFWETIRNLIGAKVQTTITVHAAHRPHHTSWWCEPQSKAAIIEPAIGIGRRCIHPAGFTRLNWILLAWRRWFGRVRRKEPDGD